MPPGGMTCATRRVRPRPPDPLICEFQALNANEKNKGSVLGLAQQEADEAPYIDRIQLAVPNQAINLDDLANLVACLPP